MSNFKVEEKHLTGQIANFPLHVVQAMVDEQVKQGNPASPSVFAAEADAGQNEGGFTWRESDLGDRTWAAIIVQGAFHLIPEPEKPQGHVHAEVMEQYAKDAKTSETPWENWEYCSPNHHKWESCGSHPAWYKDFKYRRKSEGEIEPETESNAQPKPNEIIRAMLDKGIEVWASVSDESYDEARNKIGYYMCQIVRYDETDEYPMQTRSLGWTFAVPVDWQTMTEITEMP